MEFIGLLIMVFLILLYVRQMKPGKNIKQITTSELKKHLGDTSKQFIDVRTPGEFKGSRIKGFKNIPLHTLQKNMDKLSKEKEIIVICQSGMRSAKAGKILSSSGFQSVVNVRGGMNAWSE
ncbi:rhodanese-like domain-containing protein [Bacillus sp. Marseille-Q1617]|uniref:rhodanese-like domain-containing protein n=1 Tax=Bacillus sp. Marseille-Q1617 TaxID=2736887 RepID=UPI00158A5895|nr:rhodanese-like domain-containing protein [Bacillus sp. Marseille-Q1617]